MRAFGTVLVTALLTSAFWLFAFMTGAISTPSVSDPSGTAPRERPVADDSAIETDGKVEAAGDKRVIGGITIADSVEVGPSGLAIPVAGVTASELADTFTAARAGGARRHDAIDIMADKGTPIVSTSGGKVAKIYFSEGGGGKSLYVRSDDGRWIFYYAHLDSYAPGLKEGQRVRRGMPLGRVGSTGNASPDGPHLHFAIHAMEPEEGWWDGRPINPYPLLAGKRTDR